MKEHFVNFQFIKIIIKLNRLKNKIYVMGVFSSLSRGAAVRGGGTN